MNLKKILASTLCVTTILSLTACTFNPKDAISNILNGKDQNNGNANLVAASEKVNKNAVFKETDSFTLDGFDYIDTIISANGKYYAAQTIYEYPEFDEPDYIDLNEDNYPEDGEMILFDEETPEGEDGETPEEDASKEAEPVTEDAEGEDIPSDTENEIIPEDEDYEDEYYDDYYDDDYYENIKMKFHVASFTNGNDIKYTDIELDSSEYVQGASWAVDSEENYYLSTDLWDPSTGTELYKLKKYSSDGKLIKEAELKSDEQYFYVSNLCMSSDGRIFVVSESTIQVFDKDLNNITTYSSDKKNAYITSVSLAESGDLFFQVNVWSEDKSTTTSYKMDSTGKVSEDSTLDGNLAGKDFLNGKGYDFYYRTGSSVMGMNIGDKSATEVVNFYDSDINPEELYGSICFADKEQFLSTRDMTESGGIEIVVYTKVPEDQVADKEIITLGSVYGSYDIASQIIDFNKANDTYRIKLIDYSELDTPDDWEAGRKRFYSDITGGNSPDIIVPEPADVQNLIDKGVFTDLTPLMENGNGVKKEDLVENARTVFARDDKLYAIFPTFAVEAVQIKKEYYKEGMNLDDILAWEKTTGNKALSSDYTKTGVLRNFMGLGMNAFLDPKTGKCNFDNEEFIKILEYSNTYKKEIDESYWENYNYEDYLYEFRNGKSLINFAYVDDFTGYNWNAKYRFGENPVLTGLPIEGGEGAYLQLDTVIGIANKSKHKEAAWEFVNSCFTHEYYETKGWGLPSVESEFDAKAKKSTEHQYIEDENGNMILADETYWLVDHEETVDPLTEEQAATLKDFVVKVTNVYSWDEELNNIVDEETQGYFEGQKTAQEVAAIIQSRLQIYINEKK